MSETLLSHSPESASSESLSLQPTPGEQVELTDLGAGTNEFNYRPVPIAAPITLFLGFCSSIALFKLFAPVGIGIGLFGMMLGVVVYFRIRQSRGELGGKWIAAAGALMSLAFLASGSALLAYNLATEVPPGFERLSFTKDISQKDFVVRNGQKSIHPAVAALEGAPVFLKGFMYPTQSPHNLTSFLLVKDNEVCCFGGQPTLNDMIMVHMKDGAKVDHISGLVSVAGVFHVAKSPSPAGYEAVYTIEATLCESSKTNF